TIAVSDVNGIFACHFCLEARDVPWTVGAVGAGPLAFGGCASLERDGRRDFDGRSVTGKGTVHGNFRQCVYRHSALVHSGASIAGGDQNRIISSHRGLEAGHVAWIDDSGWNRPLIGRDSRVA